MIGTGAPTVFLDADNTLWDTDRVFASAQLGLLSDVETATSLAATVEDRLAFVRAIDQELAAHHHAGLRYPARFLVKAIALALRGADTSTAARAAWNSNVMLPLDEAAAASVETSYIARLGERPQLRAGVEGGLADLREAGCVIFVVTEGARQRIERTVKHYDLDRYVDRVIEAPKRAELYSRVLKLARTPSRAFMVGDQLERDIVPAKAAGLKTIYFPGPFRPRWEPAESDVRPDYRVRNFADVPSLVLGGKQ